MTDRPRTKGKWQAQHVPGGVYIMLPSGDEGRYPAYCPGPRTSDPRYKYDPPPGMVWLWFRTPIGAGEPGMGLPAEGRPARDGILYVVWDGEHLDQVVLSPDVKVQWQRAV